MSVWHPSFLPSFPPSFLPFSSVGVAPFFPPFPLLSQCVLFFFPAGPRLPLNQPTPLTLQVEEGTRKRVLVERGDALNGDAARISVAELVTRVRALPGLVCHYHCPPTQMCTPTPTPTHPSTTGAGPAGRDERGALLDERGGATAERRGLGRAFPEAGLRGLKGFICLFYGSRLCSIII